MNSERIPRQAIGIRPHLGAGSFNSGRSINLFLWNQASQGPSVLAQVIFQQINPLVIGPDLEIEMIFSVPSVDDLPDDKGLFKEFKGNRPFPVAVARITGDFNLKNFIEHFTNLSFSSYN